MNEPEKEISLQLNKEKEEEIFTIEEIRIEELAIDGICGVY